MRFGSGNTALGVRMLDEMHFVYAFFFENGDDIYVKVGESVKPYARLVAVTAGAPFNVSQAVFCHAGTKAVARKFEAAVRKALTGFRTRGEWFVFRAADAPAFRAAVAAAYAKTTGMRLTWTKIDIPKFRQDVARKGFQYVPR